MKVALDTNGYIDFCKNQKYAIEAIQVAEEVFIPYVVLGELRAGFLCGTKSHTNEQNLTRFLNSERVKILFSDEDTTHHYARLFMQLRKQGTPIPTNDIWIASLTLQHDLYLLTNDKHFNHIAQLLKF